MSISKMETNSLAEPPQPLQLLHRRKLNYEMKGWPAVTSVASTRCGSSKLSAGQLASLLIPPNFNTGYRQIYKQS